MSPELFTTAKLAARLRVDPSTVYRLARRRAIPVVRVGTLTRFEFDDIVAALREPEQRTAAIHRVTAEVEDLDGWARRKWSEIKTARSATPSKEAGNGQRSEHRTG